MNTNKYNSMRDENQTPMVRLSLLLNFVRKILKGDRFSNLYQAISHEISIMGLVNPILLDYGCGLMNFSSRLKLDGTISEFIGMDIYPVPSATVDPDNLWANYRQITKVGMEELGRDFDIAMIVDVLHHAEERDHPRILQQLAKHCKFILVKDHFETGYVSRQLLRLADWYGNFAYGVSIPKRYFDLQSWANLVRSSGLVEVRLVKNVKVHEGLFGLLIPPKRHFISILVKDKSEI